MRAKKPIADAGAAPSGDATLISADPLINAPQHGPSIARAQGDPIS